VIARASLAFAVALGVGTAAPPPRPAAAREPDVAGVAADEIVLVGDRAGIPLSRLIELARDATGDAFLFEPKDVDTKVVFLGTVRVPKDRFLEFFEMCLRIEDFVVLDAKSPDLRVHTLRKLGQQARGQQALKTQSLAVSPAELDALRDRSLLVTTEWTFDHLDFDSLNHMLCVYFSDSACQAVRGVEGTRTLILTGFAREVRGLLEMARRLDAEIGRQGNRVVRADLAARVGALEKRVARLLERHDEPQAEVDH